MSSHPFWLAAIILLRGGIPVKGTSIVNNYQHLHIDLLHLLHVKVGREWNYSLCDNFNRLYYVIDGEGVIYTEAETVVLRPGTVYLVPAMMHFRCSCEHSLEKIYVHFKVNILPNQDILSNLDHIITFPCSAERNVKLLALMQDGGVCATLKFKIYLESIILDLIHPFEKEFEQDYTLYMKFQPFFAYTASHLYANLTIDDICSHIGMTPRQLSYRYKAATGHSVKSYLNALLLERIKYLLITTNRSMQEISAELQFSNEFYCSRFFKKNAGISPRDYRQIHSNRHYPD